MTDFLASKVELHRWLSQVVLDAQDKGKLGMELEDVILCMEDKVRELFYVLLQQRVRKG